MAGTWKTLGVALEATTAGYIGGMTKATAVTSQFGAEAEKARLQAERPPSAAGWEAFATKTEAVGRSLTKNVTVPILAFGAAAVAAAVQYDGAIHLIEQRTGATGVRMQGLKRDFDAVNVSSGASMSHIADVMSQLNVGLHLAGAPLQQLTKDFLVLERVAGSGAPTIDQVTKAANAWQITGGNVATELDHLFVASQKTGVPMNTLIDDVTRFAAPMRAAGFSIDQAAAYMGNFERAGLPASKLMQGITKFLSDEAANHRNAGASFAAIINQAKGLDEVGKTAEAQGVLVEAFGHRAGLTIADAVASGRFNISQLVADMGRGAGAIQKVGEATLPLSVRLKQAAKQIELDLVPIGEVILPAIMSALHDVIPVIGSVAHAFGDLPKPVQEWGIGLLAAAAAAGPLMTVGGALFSKLGLVGSALLRVGGAFGPAGVEAESFAGALGSVAVGLATVAVPVVALTTLLSLSGEAAANSKKKIDGLKPAHFDPNNVQSLKDYAAELSKGADAAVVADHKYTGFWHTLEYGAQTVLPGVRHTAYDTGMSIRDLSKASEEFYGKGAALSATLDEISRLTGVSRADVAGYLKEFSINPLLKSQQQTAYELMAALGGLATSVKVKGVEIKTMLAPTDAERKADAKAWKSYADTVSQAWSGFTDLLSGDKTNTTAGIRKFYKTRLYEAGSFVSDVNKAFAMGYDPNLISRIITAGPEKAGAQLHTLVSSSSKDLLSIVNDGEAKLRDITAMGLEQARIMELALHPIQNDPTGAIGRWNMAHVGQAAVGLHASTDANPLTLEQLAGATKLSPHDAGTLAANFQIPVMQPQAFERKLIEFHKWANALGAIKIKVDGDTSLVMQKALAAKWHITATDAAITIDGIPVKAIEKLTKTKVKIDSTTGTATLDADQGAALLRLKAWENHVAGTTASANLDAKSDAADAKIMHLSQEIGSIPFIGSALAKSLLNSPGSSKNLSFHGTTNANGNLYESHHPQIAPAGAMRLWAEPETGGEAYIPLHASKRSRSVDIWKKTGMLLGVHGFADGGTAWVDGNAVAAPAVRALGDFVTWERAVAAQNAAGAPGAPWNGSMGSVSAMQAFMAAQVGKPYSWGASGPGAYDCSGYVGAGVNVLEGRNPYHRIFTSASLPGSAGALGFVPGLGGPVEIGDKPGSHVAVTVNGVNYEATPPFVRSGPGARGARSPFFTRTYHLAAGQGGGLGTPPAASGGDPGAVQGLANGGIVWHGKSFDVGGPLWPGWNAVRNDTGRVEHVVPTGGGWGSGAAGGVTYSPTVEVKIMAPVYGIDDLNAAISSGVHATFQNDYPKIVATIRRKESAMS